MKLLMVNPRNYRIENAINPHMKDASGQLNRVDPHLAQQQWEALVRVFQSVGFAPEVIEGPVDLPDMVFAANHGLPFRRGSGPREILLSRMAHPSRMPEISLFRAWYEKRGFRIHEPPRAAFEGMGDALWLGDILLGGYGYRTQKDAYDEIENRLNFQVLPLKLVNPTFYHLDTCLTILNPNVVAVVESALDSDSLRELKGVVQKVISIPEEEARLHFAANGYCPDGKHVILQKGANLYSQSLRNAGFEPVPVETGEFIKGGGSVFCLKMDVDPWYPGA